MVFSCYYCSIWFHSLVVVIVAKDIPNQQLCTKFTQWVIIAGIIHPFCRDEGWFEHPCLPSGLSTICYVTVGVWLLMLGNVVSARGLETSVSEEMITILKTWPQFAPTWLVNYKGAEIAPVASSKPPPIENLTFAQTPDVRKITCHHPKCGRQGHYANSPECPRHPTAGDGVMADTAKYSKKYPPRVSVASWMPSISKASWTILSLDPISR